MAKMKNILGYHAQRGNQWEVQLSNEEKPCLLHSRIFLLTGKFYHLAWLSLTEPDPSFPLVISKKLDASQ